MTKDTYSRFAEVYDELGADRFSTQMVGYTERLMTRHKIEAHSVLDLCCGTGTAVQLFAEQGYEVAGLDGSSQMIAQARKKLSGYDVNLYCQKLPNFSIKEKRTTRQVRRFDLVTSYYDALNYLTTERKLGAAFKSVYRHLKPGGWFIFDMNTPIALRTLWSSYIWGGTKPDLAWIWTNEYDEKRAQGYCNVTLFIKRGNHWQRHDELHIEQGYSNAVIRRLLRDAGFVVSGFYRCFSYEKPTKKTNRICAVARRKD